MTRISNTPAFPRRVAPELCKYPSPKEGVGNAGCTSASAASCVKMKTHECSHHGRAGFTRHSRTRMVLTVSFVLSPGTGLCCPRRKRNAKHCRSLDASVGASGPHDFAVRLIHRVRLSRDKRPPHPAPNVRDDRETPLVQGHGTAALMDVIWANREALYFRRNGWTASIGLIGFRK